MLTDMLSCICVLKSKHLFINSFTGFEIRKKELAEWAEWAKILKNNLTDEQLCSRICFLVSACLNIYQYIHSLIAFEIKKKDWAKWAKWAKMLKNALTDKQLIIVFFLFACSNQIFIHLFIYRFWNQKKRAS